jgi:hypothetical protein
VADEERCVMDATTVYKCGRCGGWSEVRADAEACCVCVVPGCGTRTRYVGRYHCEAHYPEAERQAADRRRVDAVAEEGARFAAATKLRAADYPTTAAALAEGYARAYGDGR